MPVNLQMLPEMTIHGSFNFDVTAGDPDIAQGNRVVGTTILHFMENPVTGAHIVLADEDAKRLAEKILAVLKAKPPVGGIVIPGQNGHAQ